MDARNILKDAHSCDGRSGYAGESCLRTLKIGNHGKGMAGQIRSGEESFGVKGMNMVELVGIEPLRSVENM